jgi:carboxylesterase type B
VRGFRGIPYAEPPLGPHRFRPHVTKKPEAHVVSATYFGSSCIQLDTGAPTVYTQYLQGFLLTPGQQQAEDCLTLNFRAPRVVLNQSLLVMIYLPGGAFARGGSASPYKYGEEIVRAHQDVVVVSVKQVLSHQAYTADHTNYRLNIFGFPNAAALDGHNLNPGFLDQRKAVEWLHYEIAAFGVDPTRMVFWDQPAGAASVDKYTYAWNDDPLVRGFILDSGTTDGFALGGQGITNFTYVAEQVNCTQQDEDSMRECMQCADADAIISVLDKYNTTANGGVTLSFGPVADNETSFSNYTD